MFLSCQFGLTRKKFTNSKLQERNFSFASHRIESRRGERQTSAGTELFWQQLKDETVKKKDGRLNKETVS